tara:strand:- start:1359 stop:1751 length:393 start_codon:yes stop_codon:yes gene_type:complete
MIVLVCGGSDYGHTDHKEQAHIYSVLNTLNTDSAIDIVVSSCSKGTDTQAMLWAGDNNIMVHVHSTNWTKYGKSAEPRRNAEMLKSEDVDLVVAFPGSAGTQDMIHKAITKGIEVMYCDKPSINQNQVVL